jgi:hypothetical protein
MRRTDPATGTNHPGTNDTRAPDAAPPHHGAACNAAAGTDDRGSAHGAATSRADLDYRTILLELLLKRTAGSANEC